MYIHELIKRQCIVLHSMSICVIIVIQRFPGLKTISNMHHSTLFLSEVFNYLQKHHHLCCNNQKDEKALSSCSGIICKQEMASQKILALKKVGRFQNFF